MALLYVVGCVVGTMCAGTAEAGDVVGNGWLNWTDCVFCDDGAGGPFCAIDWIVVKVVARDLTEGAGLENVLSPPCRESWPPPIVRAVPVTELAPWLGAVREIGRSPSDENVPAILRPPVVGGTKSSTEYLVDWPTDWKPVCWVPNDVTLCARCWPWFRLTTPDSGYGLLSFWPRFTLLYRFDRSLSRAVLKLVSFLTQVENGLRLWVRSSNWLLACNLPRFDIPTSCL